jgi:hypothetical protein
MNTSGISIMVNPLALGDPSLKTSGYTTPAFAPRTAVSDWVMGNMSSSSVSCGIKAIANASAAIGKFQLAATNKRTGQTIRVVGAGAGFDLGVSPPDVPCSIGGDIPWAPSWHGEFYLGPAGNNNMGAQLFQGVAILADLEAEALIGPDLSILSFMTNKSAGPAGVKAWTWIFGLDWTTDPSAGGSALVYIASVYSADKTKVVAGNPRWLPAINLF